MLVLVLLVVLMLLLSAFFSGSEIAYLSANKLSVEVFKNKGLAKGKAIHDLYKDPKTFLSTMLVGNNIVLVMYTIFFGKLLQPLMSQIFLENSFLYSLVATIIMTIVLLIFGEFLPKTIFRLYADEMIYRFSYALKIAQWILLVPSKILTYMSNIIIRLLFGKIPNTEDQSITKLDLEHYINSNVDEQKKDIDKEILTKALNLNQLKVKDCMIPRKEIVFVDKTDDVETIKQLFVESKHSRLIVVDTDIEHVIGYLHHQQLFRGINLKRNIREIDFFPDVMNVQDLMYTFIKSNSNIAIVVDEFGGTAGLITLEDILEEIFGEIEDEHDIETLTETVISENEFVFSGRLELDYLNGKYPQLQFPSDEFSTLSGLIVMTHGNIPEVGEKINIDNYAFTILSKSDTKIEEVGVLIESEHSDKSIEAAQ